MTSIVLVSSILLLAAITAINGFVTDNTRIAVDSIARPDQFPYVAAIRVRRTMPDDGKLAHFCSGAILNERWILTELGCTRFNVRDTFVRVGTNVVSDNSNNNGITYPVDRFVQHEYHDQPQINWNHIALVRVSEPIRFGANVQPIELETKIVGSGAFVTIVGFGAPTVGV